MTKLFNIPNPDSPKSISPNLFSALDLEVDRLLEAPRARTNFNVDGSGLAVAVLDTGLRTTHKCFTDRVIATRNFTSDDGGNTEKVTDFNGHGTMKWSPKSVQAVKL